jgi:glycosyltransferase involved in cell wall biosynthesis
MLDFQKIRLPFSLFFLRILSTCALKLSSKVLVPSSVMYSVCLNWGINQSSLVKVYNSVNLSRFRPQGLPKKFDLISVSRLISIKGIEEVIKTAKELDFSLLIVGEGPSLHQLKTLADKLEGRVTFFGSATQVQLPELYEASGVFILNSEFEAGTPYSLLEARASGLICIGRENTGCEDVITNGVDGFLCGPKSGLDLKAALQQVKALSNRKMQEFGLTAISDTSVRFSQESIFRTILKEIS